MAASQVLYEGMPGDDELRAPVVLQSTHRSEPVLELPVIRLDRIIGVLLDVMPHRRKQLLEHARVDRSSVGDHLARCHFQGP